YMKDINKICIHIHNQSQKLSALYLLNSLSGIPINRVVLQDTKGNKSISDYCYIYVYNKEYVSASCSRTFDTIDIEFDEIYQIYTKKPPVVIKLNDTYSAEVHL